MDLSKIQEILSKVSVSLTDASFYPKIFTLIAKERKKEKLTNEKALACGEEYDDLSRRLDHTGIQESCSVRNILRTRALANLLVDDKGELNGNLLSSLVATFVHELYSLGPDRQHDSRRQEHLLHALQTLLHNKKVITLLKNISRPHAHQNAEDVIRDTLQLPANTIITDAHARRAALSAYLCFLRQNIGSCFATAPAIIIHDEQPEQFFVDINDLLSTGRLKRTFGGVEYTVPLSVSWGAGDLRKPLILPIDGNYNEIWLSPGLIAAFQAAGLLEPKTALKERVEQTKAILIKALKKMHSSHSYIFTSPQELIRKALMHQLKITDEDLEQFEIRPRGMIHSSLLMQVPQSSGGKGQACATFKQLEKLAFNAFKSLADNALLKSWEFTLASFSETKEGFTNWNLYSSLGFDPKDQGGIGQKLHEIVQRKLDEANQKVQEMQDEYEVAYGQVKFLEGRLRGASTEKEIQWMKAEYQSKSHEFYMLEEMRNKYNAKASGFAALFKDLINKYINLFPVYFQEVYDADMHEVSTGPYDDSPAGFRLLYKYGRANTAQWEMIYNPSEFIEALVNFFNTTENEIRASEEMQGFEMELGEIVTAIVTHVRTEEFLETAFHRMAIAHKIRPIKDPLRHLNKIEKKPWAYVSGGTMDNLVSCYYRRDQNPTTSGRWVENPMELFVFLVDVMKQMPYKLAEDFIKNPQKAMLMHSPTHAFLFKPGIHSFKATWQGDAFTYTWARDHFVKPMQYFIDFIMLDEEMVEYLIQILVEKVPKNFQHYFRKVLTNFYGTMNPIEFRQHLVDQMERDRGLMRGGQSVLSPDEIDHTLFTQLPLFPKAQLRERIDNIFKELTIKNHFLKKNLGAIIDLVLDQVMGQNIISAKALQDICKAILCLGLYNTNSEVDYHREVAVACQKLGYAMPRPIQFADTNWVKDEFAFLVNPGTGRLELWRVDVNGTTGYPMSIWEQWLNGSRRDINWAVFNKPYEYSS